MESEGNGEMREILFRGKIVRTGEWVCGGIVHQTDHYGEPVDRYFIIDGTETQDYDIGYEYEVIPETVGQFTGLYDKNGKRIFEGDILCISGCYFDVIYRNGGFVWRDMRLNKFASYANYDSNIEQFCFVEVIGTIYENHELLEEL